MFHSMLCEIQALDGFHNAGASEHRRPGFQAVAGTSPSMNGLPATPKASHLVASAAAFFPPPPPLFQLGFVLDQRTSTLPLTSSTKDSLNYETGRISPTSSPSLPVPLRIATLISLTSTCGNTSTTTSSFKNKHTNREEKHKTFVALRAIL